MCVEVHRLNSTRRKAPADSRAALVSPGMHLGVRFSLREPETQLTRSRHAPTMKLITGFLGNVEKPAKQRATNSPSIPQNSGKLPFCGVRGSTPTLERDSWRYGGNTACLELTIADGPHFILDCGT